MKTILHLIPLSTVLLALAACSGSGSAEENGGGPAADVVALRKAAAELMARPEHSDGSVEVQHLLVSFAGTPRTRATRSRDEAEALTADLWRRCQAGEDFDALVKEHTDDQHPGKYPMTAANRSGMVQGFGDVSWRLLVGEYGVAAHDPGASPFGWHIIKRLE